MTAGAESRRPATWAGWPLLGLDSLEIVGEARVAGPNRAQPIHQFRQSDRATRSGRPHFSHLFAVANDDEALAVLSDAVEEVEEVRGRFGGGDGRAHSHGTSESTAERLIQDRGLECRQTLEL